MTRSTNRAWSRPWRTRRPAGGGSANCSSSGASSAMRRWREPWRAVGDPAGRPGTRATRQRHRRRSSPSTLPVPHKQFRSPADDDGVEVVLADPTVEARKAVLRPSAGRSSSGSHRPARCAERSTPRTERRRTSIGSSPPSRPRRPIRLATNDVTLTDAAASAPVVRVVDSIVTQALRDRALRRAPRTAGQRDPGSLPRRRRAARRTLAAGPHRARPSSAASRSWRA